MRGQGRDHCVVCGQRGTVVTDADGCVLVEHGGRMWPCRPRPTTAAEWLRVQASVLVAGARAEAST